MTYILRKLVLPVIIVLLLAITIPYVSANLFVPLVGKSIEVLVWLIFVVLLYSKLLKLTVKFESWNGITLCKMVESFWFFCPSATLFQELF